MRTGAGFELTYCTNIHAANGWQDVFANIRRYVPELKRRLSPHTRFGLGLRLSNDEAIELLSSDHLREFATFLGDHHLYVALINGFPYGGFHDCPLKDEVFAPDWHSEERVSYTLRLFEILSVLLPADLDGGVSTCPLSYKDWPNAPDWNTLIRNVVRIENALRGTAMHLDIEPEPDGLVENTSEFLDFYGRLAARPEHIALCYDVCHFAVEYESPADTLARIQAADIPIGRVQISSALKAPIPSSATTLSGLVDRTYLHQVIGNAERFPDLPQALAQIETARSREWRVHYHVPLFVEDYGSLSSTQAEVRATLSSLTPERVRHLEIETYTWGVLPPELKLDLVDSIEREYRWVLAQL
jgi:sugar phosphate isomerase/epimerase